MFVDFDNSTIYFYLTLTILKKFESHIVIDYTLINWIVKYRVYVFAVKEILHITQKDNAKFDADWGAYLAYN